MAPDSKISRYSTECSAFRLDVLVLPALISWKLHKNGTFSIPHTVSALTGGRWEDNSKRNVSLYF